MNGNGNGNGMEWNVLLLLLFLLITQSHAAHMAQIYVHIKADREILLLFSRLAFSFPLLVAFAKIVYNCFKFFAHTNVCKYG